ncbi:hypothetical protein [Ochrobactrum chromiisoli]|uniref:Uncharacterized protein n=1 Tax=Ochrobactrum chromiisoli TaxID=2993941 RepID=A0ABT3QM26_9HYPH|nr:hypothetical protein [Ochrobactrum chromiisoli]MCX2696667.1 hypothetical protein [Ochrobactrum chromiisoli]
MTRNELKQQISDLIADRLAYGSMDVMCDEILATILAAIQDPTEAALEAGYAWDEHVTATETHPRNRGLWRAMLNASPLGEKAE